MLAMPPASARLGTIDPLAGAQHTINVIGFDHQAPANTTKSHLLRTHLGHAMMPLPHSPT